MNSRRRFPVGPYVRRVEVHDPQRPPGTTISVRIIPDDPRLEAAAAAVSHTEADHRARFMLIPTDRFWCPSEYELAVNKRPVARFKMPDQDIDIDIRPKVIYLRTPVRPPKRRRWWRRKDRR